MGIDIFASGLLRAKARNPLEDPDALVGPFLQHFESLNPPASGRAVGSNEDECVSLQLSPFPGAEITLRFGGDRSVECTARTSPIGPGFHEFVTQYLRALEKSGVCQWKTIEDETDYAATGDRRTLEAHMVSWVRGMAEMLRREGSLGAGGPHNISIAMDVRTLYSADPQHAITPLGPRDAAWWARAERDDATAREFFAWWDSGSTPAVLRNAALMLMWTEVRWRHPLLQEEVELNDRVLRLLESAYAGDPTLTMPFAEWAELHAFARDETEALAFPVQKAKQSGAPIGYRRRDVVERVGPFMVGVPGSWARGEEEGAVVLLEEDHTIQLTAFTPGTPSDPAEMAEDFLADEDDSSFRILSKERRSYPGLEVAARTYVQTDEESGDDLLSITALLVRPEDGLLITLIARDEEGLSFLRGLLADVERLNSGD